MSTLDLLFIGHQTWCVRHTDVTVLIDPILGDTMGHRARLPVHPPRTVDLPALGPIDLVVLTHEHNDHTDLRSLHRLDRTVPVLVAPLMPAVVVRAVERLGFTVHRADPDVALDAGGLQLQLLPGGRHFPVGEGRVAQVLLTATTAAGPVTVLVGVDTVVSAHTASRMHSGHLPAPHAVIVANNTQIPPLGVLGSVRDLLGSDPADGFTGLALLRELCVDYVASLPGTPAVLLCGGGFLDTHELGVPYRFDDHPRLAALARSLSFGRPVFGPQPGDLLRLSRTDSGVAFDEDTHPAVTVDDTLAAAIRARPTPTGPLPLRSVLPDLPLADRAAALQRVDRALNALVPQLLTHPSGAAIVACHHHAGRTVGPRRLLVRLVGGPDGAVVWRALDLTESCFVPVTSIDEARVFDDWPFGFEVFLQDLDALLEGSLVVWDVLSIALRHWSADGPGVAHFLCAALGEAVRPRATAQVLARELTHLGVPTRAAQLLPPVP